MSRFKNRDRFAACNGTAPDRGVLRAAARPAGCRRRGNRRINHAIHMAAVTQIRQPHSEGRAYYDKKLAEGKTHREALRALKRRFVRITQLARAAGIPPGDRDPAAER